jgi:PHYB activation tagged suppressor 1
MFEDLSGSCFALTGKNFVYWFGPVPRIVIPESELIREFLCNKSMQYEKPEPASQVRHLLGDGLVTSRGEKWTRQRRLINPAFHAEALKVNISLALMVSFLFFNLLKLRDE